MYFLLQSCSGHSSSTGEIGHGTAVLHFLAGICTLRPVSGLMRLFVSLLSSRPPPPFTGDGLSSLDLRFSGRGGKNAVGDVDGVLEPPVVEPLPPPDDELAEAAEAPLPVVVVVAVVVACCAEPSPPEELLLVAVVGVAVPLVVVDEVRPPRPLAPPLRSLLCTYGQIQK